MERRGIIKMSRKLISSVIALLMTFSLLAGCTGPGRGEDNIASEEVNRPMTDTSFIAKVLPGLEGVTETEWEEIRLGSDDRMVPGPTDYQYEGYVTISEEAADKYLSEYEWSEAEPDVTFEYIRERDGDWKYSYDFEKAVSEGAHYSVSVWIDGNTILFKAMTF